MIKNILAALAAFVAVAYTATWLIDLFGIPERFQMWTTVGIGAVVFMAVFIPLSSLSAIPEEDRPTPAGPEQSDF
ncbi:MULTISPECIES: hypothetical protein [unclassified Maridesulfovibrio]|uniref:hypothetical protein n=1 Tax=unclassified Maridesulfovibrio TaxID=2794999 RepID=UPI003B3C105D